MNTSNIIPQHDSPHKKSMYPELKCPKGRRVIEEVTFALGVEDEKRLPSE